MSLNDMITMHSVNGSLLRVNLSVMILDQGSRLFLKKKKNLYFKSKDETYLFLVQFFFLFKLHVCFH